MLRIRLQRTGNKNNPSYRLVVTEKTNAAKRMPLEILGHYLPTREPIILEFDASRVDHWIKNGAIPTDTVARLLHKQGLKGLEKYIERYTKKRKKKAIEETPTAEAKAAGEKDSQQEKKEEAKAEEKNEEPKKEEITAEKSKKEAKEEDPKSESTEKKVENTEEDKSDKKEGDA